MPNSSSLVDELAGMRSRIAEMTDILWSAHEAHELMWVVAQAEAFKATLDALELCGARELEATGAVKSVGWASTQDVFDLASLS